MDIIDKLSCFGSCTEIRFTPKVTWLSCRIINTHAQKDSDSTIWSLLLQMLLGY